MNHHRSQAQRLFPATAGLAGFRPVAASRPPGSRAAPGGSLRRRTKRTLACLAVLGAAGVHAQSNVSLYGRLDASVNSLHFSGPGSASVRSVSSDSSFWGLRGVEDLGGGLSAYFKMESQFQVDTGSQGSPAAYFNRETYVGLRSSTLGSLALGAQYTPHIWLTARVDPFSRGFLGHIANLFQGGARGYQPIMNNSILYTSPNWSGFTARMMVGLAEGGLGNSRGAGLEYVAGPLAVGVSYDDLRKSSTSVGLPAGQPSVRSRTVALGASYGFPLVRLMGYYQRNHTEQLPSVDGWMLGAVVPVGTAGAVRLGYSRNSITHASEASQLALGYTHALSKRTTVYSTVAKIRNEGSRASLWPARQDIGASGLPAAGQDVRGLQVGIRHLF